MNKNEFIRRSITIPKELDFKIKLIKQDYSYPVKNDLFIELLELGVLKFYEDSNRNKKIDILLDRTNYLLDSINN